MSRQLLAVTSGIGPQQAADRLLAGRNYRRRRPPIVKHGVEDFAAKYGLRIRHGPDTVWSYERPRSS